MQRCDLGVIAVVAAIVGCTAQEEPRVAEWMPRPLGRIVTEASAGSCEGDRCITFRVDSDSLANAAAGRLVVTEPAVQARGTILIFSGGSGTSLWGAPIPEWGRLDVSAFEETMAAWTGAGFRVVRVQWDSNWWVGSGESEGFDALACRPATVTNWVAENLVEEGLPLCTGGGSGGAGQVSYPLTHYGLENRVALAVPWSGFWMGRIDIGCLDDDPLTGELHYSEAARRAIDLSYGVPREENGPCVRRDESFRPRFTAASISAGGDLHYPRTLVWHILGGGDDVGALGHGLTYYEAMLRAGSPHARSTVLPGVPHGVERTEVGMAKIRDVMLQECRLR